ALVRLSTLPLHDALPISLIPLIASPRARSFDKLIATPPPILLNCFAVESIKLIEFKLSSTSNRKQLTNSPRLALPAFKKVGVARSEEHTSELQSRFDLVC